MVDAFAHFCFYFSVLKVNSALDEVMTKNKNAHFTDRSIFQRLVVASEEEARNVFIN